MSLFWLEYAHFIGAIGAILVSISAFSLFLLTYRYEHQLRTIWRAIGFLLLAIAFFFFILERKIGSFGLVGAVISTLGFCSIYKGVLAEPKLTHLKKSGQLKKDNNKIFNISPGTIASLIGLIIVVIIGGWIFKRVNQELFGLIISYLPVIFEMISLVFIIVTIRIQIKRYLGEKSWQNIYPLAGYIFFVFRSIPLIIYRFPELNIVFFRQQGLDFSLSWQLAVLFTISGFALLGVWAWNFIKVRVFLRTYVVFLTIAIIVSTLGALVFTMLIFTIVEKNNLGLMDQGAETQELIMQDRSNLAMFVARTMATDDQIVSDIRNNNYEGLKTRSEDYLKSSNLDILRIYNRFGEVLVSPSDERDRGRVYSKDKLVTFVLSERKLIKSFETQNGVLADLVITRALYPLVVGTTVVGAVETGYVFDNAFVDFSKDKTGLDVTTYAGAKRSSTTLTTRDGVSRWVGSEETDENVKKIVLEDGESYSSMVDRLGQIYYSAFKPLLDVNGEIIGMVSVGTPTQILFEDTRQQLVSSFLIVTVISLLAAVLGYYLLFSAQRRMKAASK